MEMRPDQEPLRSWEKACISLLLVAAVAFGVLVEIRSAFLSRRMGDLGVFLRGAWAVRTGNALYDVACDNNWHYNYPPLFAIFMAPLADPPPGESTAGMTPYAVSVGIFYVLSVFCAFLGAHLLAGAFEESVPGLRAQRGGRRWWCLRVFPLIVCLPPLGHSLARGQVNPFLLLLFCSLIAGVLRGRRFVAGLCLAVTICIKVIPAFLLIYPLWRRDTRLLAGCALGLVLGLAVIPAAYMGPREAVQAHVDLFRVCLGPALGLSEDRTRAKELIETTATCNVSFQAAIHYATNLNPATRADVAAPWVKRTHWLLGAALTLATLLAVGWRRAANPLAEALGLGGLIVVNLVISPVCHLHYFCLAVPLAMALVAAEWQRNDAAGVATRCLWLPVGLGIFLLTVVQIVAYSVSQLPSLVDYRNLGVPTYGILLLWLAGFLALLRMPAFVAMEPAEGGWETVLPLSEAAGLPLEESRPRVEKQTRRPA